MHIKDGKNENRYSDTIYLQIKTSMNKNVNKNDTGKMSTLERNF